MNIEAEIKGISYDPQLKSNLNTVNLNNFNISYYK